MRISRLLSLLLPLLATYPAWGAALDDARAGSAAYGQGDLKGALTNLSQAIDSGELKDDDLVTALNNRAVVYDAMGRWDDAVGDYERALKAMPDNAQLKANLAAALLRRGDDAVKNGRRDTAVADYDRALALVPTLQAASMRRTAMKGGSVGKPAAAIKTASQTGGSASYEVIKAVNVRGGPDTGAPVLSTLKEGEVVDAIGETDGWLALRMGDGSVGYAYGTYLQRR